MNDPAVVTGLMLCHTFFLFHHGQFQPRFGFQQPESRRQPHNPPANNYYIVFHISKTIKFNL
jgi:hypothetical protein